MLPVRSPSRVLRIAMLPEQQDISRPGFITTELKKGAWGGGWLREQEKVDILITISNNPRCVPKSIAKL